MKKDLCPICGSPNIFFLIRDRFTQDNIYERCLECGSGLSRLRVQDISESARLHTGVYYSPENSGFNPVPRAEAYFLSRILKYKPQGGKLLDVGCGRGQWLDYIRGHSSFEVEGVEPSEEAADYARSILELPVRAGDLFSARYPDGIFDVVYLRNVLEHAGNPRSLLGEIHRVLKEGGICAVHVPNDASLTNRLKRVFYRLGIIREYGSLFYPIHVTGFIPHSLDLIFEDKGFFKHSRVTISKAQRIYEFPLVFFDILLYPVALLEKFFRCGNLLVGWYEKRQGE